MINGLLQEIDIRCQGSPVGTLIGAIAANGCYPDKGNYYYHIYHYKAIPALLSIGSPYHPEYWEERKHSL